jgi:hypothetical protein
VNIWENSRYMQTVGYDPDYILIELAADWLQEHLSDLKNPEEEEDTLALYAALRIRTWAELLPGGMAGDTDISGKPVTVPEFVHLPGGRLPEFQQEIDLLTEDMTHHQCHKCGSYTHDIFLYGDGSIEWCYPCNRIMRVEFEEEDDE